MEASLGHTEKVPAFTVGAGTWLSPAAVHRSSKPLGLSEPQDFSSH